LRILILGRGFLGKSLETYLSDELGSRICLSRNSLVFDQYFNFFDETSLRRAIDEFKPEVVINTIWTTETGTYLNSPANLEFSIANINLAKICIEKEVEHLISLGSSAEYGDNPGACNAEVSPCNPENVYARSKFETFQAISDMYCDSSLRFTWVRIFQPYGKFQDSTRFIPSVVYSFSQNQAIKLKNPKVQLDWIHAIDVVRGIEFIIQNKTPMVVDLGGSTPLYNFQVVNVVAEIMGVDTPMTGSLDLVATENSRYVSRESFLLRSWKPTISLFDGVRSLVKDFEKN
jgi:nucleoside-diphosphate-sugar epimerase